jgi:hypothetical protein
VLGYDITPHRHQITELLSLYIVCCQAKYQAAAQGSPLQQTLAPRPSCHLCLPAKQLEPFSCGFWFTRAEAFSFSAHLFPLAEYFSSPGCSDVKQHNSQEIQFLPNIQRGFRR